MIMGAGPAFVAYHGARVPSLGTSPLAIAVPSGEGAVVLDMATSAISNGTILQACATGASLPPNSALTKEGEPTTDPNRAEILLPLGGPKGSGLGFMFEMLASVLATAPIQAPALGPERRKSLSQNMAILAVDVATFRPIVDFCARCRCARCRHQIAAAPGGLRRNPAAR
jgi:ureidoglycolate dehydrogenase (NAD+)